MTPSTGPSSRIVFEYAYIVRCTYIHTFSAAQGIDTPVLVSQKSSHQCWPNTPHQWRPEIDTPSLGQIRLTSTGRIATPPQIDTPVPEDRHTSAGAANRHTSAGGSASTRGANVQPRAARPPPSPEQSSDWVFPATRRRAAIIASSFSPLSSAGLCFCSYLNTTHNIQPCQHQTQRIFFPKLYCYWCDMYI